MRTPAVREEIKRIASFWLGKGVDGFRLDAARHLIETGDGTTGQADTPETHAFWKEFAEHVRSVKPDAVLVGEDWTTTPLIAAYYGSTERLPQGDELPLNFNFPLARALLEAAQSGDGNGIALKLSEMSSHYPAGVADTPFLTNHDNIRVATQLAGKPGPLVTAASVMLTLPGSPFLYYGEELGPANGPTAKDEDKRTPMPWDSSAAGGFTTGSPWFAFAPGHELTNVATQTKNPGSLLSRYRELIRARHASPALERGGLTLLTSTRGRAPTLAFLRTLGAERVLVVHNLGDTAQTTGPLELEAELLEPLFTDASVGSPAKSGTAWSVTLPGRATGIWRLR
ncbi:alpha-amylase family glycosyl hydrolase [Cystobacter fuscus]